MMVSEAWFDRMQDDVEMFQIRNNGQIVFDDI